MNTKDGQTELPDEGIKTAVGEQQLDFGVAGMA